MKGIYFERSSTRFRLLNESDMRRRKTLHDYAVYYKLSSTDLISLLYLKKTFNTHNQRRYNSEK